MTGRRLLTWAVRAYPRDARERDSEVLLDCAEELIEAGSSSPRREAADMLRAGLRARAAGVADLPWREAAARLALPLAAANLAIWSQQAASRLWGPVGEWWPMMLLSAVAALFGTAFGRARLAALGWLAGLALLALYYLRGGASPATVYFEFAIDAGGGIAYPLSSVDLAVALVPFMLLGAAASLASEPVRAAWWGLLVLPTLTLAVCQRAFEPRSGLVEATLLGCVLLAPAAVIAAGRRSRVNLMIGAVLVAAGLPLALWTLFGFVEFPTPMAILGLYAGGTATGLLTIAALLRAARASERRPRGERTPQPVDDPTD